MMTPDSRPIGVLTPTILATASHWCLYGDGIADTRPSAELVLSLPAFDGDLPPLMYRNDCYWNDDSNWMCYPCTLQPNGLVVPEPWPVLDGEDVIQACDGADPAYWETHQSKDNWWRLRHYAQGMISCGHRLNMHPAPRKGKTGIVWVWEKDRC